MAKSEKSLKWLCIALALCLVGALGAGLVQNSFGRVNIIDVVLETDTGTLTGYLLVPKGATAQTPAPAIVTSHGYLNNKEMQDINYVELSRRGFVVFAMDAYSHGHSSVALEGKGSDISRRTGGMTDAVAYLAGLSFVDSARIGVTGHSMGGGYADATASYYTSLEKEALAAGATPQEAAALNQVAAALVIGNVPSGLNDNAPYFTELGVIGGRYDEFFIVTLGDSVVELLSNPIALQLVSLQQGSDQVTAAGEIIEGQRYVNDETGYGITMWAPWEIHPWNHFSRTSAGHAVDFFEQSLGAPNPLPAGNQTWWLKEAFNGVGLAGFFLLLVPMADLLMRTKFFAPLKAMGAVAEVERPAKKGRYIAASLINALVSAILLLPLIAVGFLLLVNAFWPQDTTGGIGLWSLGCGLVSLLILRIGGLKFCKDRDRCGTAISGKNLGKTVLLALCITAGMWLTVFMADWLFQTDFRIWSFAARTFSASKIWVALKYLPFFLVFYVANSLAVSRNRFQGWSERKQIWVSAGWNVLGVGLFIALQYIPLLINGKTFFGSLLTGILASAGALFPILVFPFVPILAIAAAVGVKLYRRTGNIYLAGLTNALVITMLTVANTSFSFPY
jgi:hypothetical protein